MTGLHAAWTFCFLTGNVKKEVSEISLSAQSIVKSFSYGKVISMYKIVIQQNVHFSFVWPFLVIEESI